MIKKLSNHEFESVVQICIYIKMIVLNFLGFGVLHPCVLKGTIFEEAFLYMREVGESLLLRALPPAVLA